MILVRAVTPRRSKPAQTSLVSSVRRHTVYSNAARSSWRRLRY